MAATAPSPALAAQLTVVKGHYPHAKAAMVPVLRAVQAELGWLSPETQAWVAAFLGVTPLEVHEVVSFYPMLYDKPVGRHVIHVCRTLSCDACGGKELFEHRCSKLGVGRGGTTKDGRFTLKAAECLASCGTAPVVLIDNERHENLTHEQVDKLLEAAR
jgi:NADH-quinone oxidoreductase subunit E